MLQIITTEKVPIKLWLNDLEEGALRQARNLANLPFAFQHVAIMPDSHEGFGMPIGGILATKGFVVPNAVGVDIGCGMCAVKTSLSEIDTPQLQSIINLIRNRIPRGTEHHKKPQDESLMPKGYMIDEMQIVKQEYESALHQIGTLGGGNHFIEIQTGNDGNIWIMLHSGSRNIGKKVADFYFKKAVHLNELQFSHIDKPKDLSFLPVGTQEAQEYLNEMNYCVEFAFANRLLMMETIKDCFTNVVSGISFAPIINIAHNYARLENHFDHDVIVHRKGATSANKGEIGIISGSQGTKSYIVEGLGNPESFRSCAHGAGRILGRKQARRELDLKTEIDLMNRQGIIHGIRSVRDLDEAVGAYKDIDIVMANQRDLVKILYELKPIAVVKE